MKGGWAAGRSGWRGGEALLAGVADFRWDESVWGSSWAWMGCCVFAYLLLVYFLKLLLHLRSKPLPLGPLPALYHLSLLLASLAIFSGCLQSARLEIHESRWIWRRRKTEIEWLLCFPIGMRPIGRVFFWTYTFYLTKYFEFLGTLILLLQKQTPSAGHVYRHVTMVIMSFLQLQFSQSLQILVLLLNTSLYVVMHLYFLLSSIGWAPSWYRDLVHLCQFTKVVAIFFASLGLLTLHFTTKEGCNGMGSWMFITLLNSILLILTSHLDSKRKFF